MQGGNLALTPGLPTQIGMLANMVNLKLDSCGFSGTVPTQVGELTALNNFLLRGTTLGLQPVTNRFRCARGHASSVAPLAAACAAAACVCSRSLPRAYL
mgnify:CR=1 FL=1